MDRTKVVTDPDDPRLADFVALNQPATRREVERAGGYFVVEGVVAVEQLLALPQWEVRSIALIPRLVERLGPRLGARADRLVTTDEATLRTVVGFDLHRGALASVQRLAPAPAVDLLDRGRRQLLLVGEGLNDHENLGALYRNAAAFGVDAVLLDSTCADPFYRRSVRVSSGLVLRVPTGALGPLPSSLATLHEAGVTTVALTPRADDLADLDLPPGRSIALLVGAEGPGLTTATLDAADHRGAIRLAPGVDSLNVATAAAVALFAVTRGARR